MLLPVRVHDTADDGSESDEAAEAGPVEADGSVAVNDGNGFGAGLGDEMFGPVG